nr:uncharacterized protein LOC105484582 isoform X2 [Macaca nemestrina]
MLSDSHWESICTDLLNAWYVQEEGIQWSCKTCLRTGPGATPWHTLRLSLGPAITELRTWMQLNKENLCDSLVLTTPWNASTAPGPPFCPKRKPASSLRAPTTAAPIIVTTSDPPSKGIRKTRDKDIEIGDEADLKSHQSSERSSTHSVSHRHRSHLWLTAAPEARPAAVCHQHEVAPRALFIPLKMIKYYKHAGL